MYLWPLLGESRPNLWHANHYSFSRPVAHCRSLFVLRIRRKSYAKEHKQYNARPSRVCTSTFEMTPDELAASDTVFL